MVVWAAGQWLEGHQVGLERQPVLTASLPPFPSHCFVRKGGIPTVPLSHGTVEQRRGRQGQASDKPKGSLARPSPPCTPDRSQWPGTHLSKFPWKAAGEPKPPRCLHPHQLHLPLRRFNAAELLEVLGNIFSKGFGRCLEEMASTVEKAQAGRDDAGDQTAT